MKYVGKLTGLNPEVAVQTMSLQIESDR